MDKPGDNRSDDPAARVWLTWLAFPVLVVCACHGPNPAFTATAQDAAREVGVGREADVGMETASSPETTPGDRLPPDATFADGGQAEALVAGDATDSESPADADVIDGSTGDDAAPDGPPDAGVALPPGATASLRSVMVGAGGTTPVYGGTGGSRYTDDCATAGEMVIGYAGYKNTYTNTPNEYVISVQLICGRAEIPAGSTVARVVSMRTAPLRGDMRGTTWRAQCPQDQAVVGYTVLLDDDEQAENLMFHCAPLHVSPSGSGAILPGTVTMLTWVGRLGTGPHAVASCPQGQVGRGHVVRVGSWIDALHMTCGVLSAGP